MPNAIKYKAGNLTGSLQKGNVALGVSGSFGPTSTTGWYNGPNPPTSGLYQIIETAASGDPEVYSPQNDAELIRFARWKGATGADTGSVAAVLAWVGTQTNLMAINFQYESIVTDGLVLNLDAGFVGSYPTTASTWYDLSGNNNSGSLINGPTFNSANSGSIVFDGVDDLMSTSYSIEAATSANLQTFCSWVYGTTTPNSFFGSGANGFGQFHIILYFSNPTQLLFGESYYGGGQAPFDQTNVVNVSPNSTWNHACIVKTAASTFDVYFNGTKVITGATKAATQPAPFYLGRWWLSQPCPSRTANVQIYNRALTSTEVLQNYNAQKGRFGL